MAKANPLILDVTTNLPRERGVDDVLQLYLDEMIFSSDYIVGLRLIWNSATSISIDVGGACIPGSAFYIASNSMVTLSGLSLSANTWYHIYLHDIGGAPGGNPGFEIQTTAPQLYFGVAYQKTSDASRRYLGSLRTDGSGNVLQFQHNPINEAITYLGADHAQRNVLTGGKASTTTNVDCSSMVPVTAQFADLVITNTDATVLALSSNSTAGLPLGTGAGKSYIGYHMANSVFHSSRHPVDSAQKINYSYLSTPLGGLNVDVNGYEFWR